MLVTLRSLWEEIYPLNEQFHFVGLLSLGRSDAPYVGVTSEAAQSGGGAVVRIHKRRRNRGLDSEPAWKTPALTEQLALINDDDEILAILAA